MPSARTSFLISAIERDRRTLELIGVRAAVRFGLRARLHAISALRVGGDPVRALRDVILGNDRLDQSGIMPLMVDAMVAGHIDGRRRTALIATPELRSARALSRRPAFDFALSLENADRRTYSRVGVDLKPRVMWAKDQWGEFRRYFSGTAYDGALDFLKARMSLDEGQLDELRVMYASEAATISSTMATQLSQAVQQALITTTAEGGGVADGVKALRNAFETEGFTPGADYTLENVFRTQTQLAYSAGRENALRDPAIQEILHSFTYNTVGDDRVRPTHAAMDGITRPADDPLWNIWTPPCGYNCRCAKLENYETTKLTRPDRLPDVQPDDGFDFNPGDLFRDTIVRADAGL